MSSLQESPAPEDLCKNDLGKQMWKLCIVPETAQECSENSVFLRIQKVSLRLEHARKRGAYAVSAFLEGSRAPPRPIPRWYN